LHKNVPKGNNPKLVSGTHRDYSVVAITDMGKPLFKASDGGRIDILRQWEDATESELQQGFRM